MVKQGEASAAARAALARERAYWLSHDEEETMAMQEQRRSAGVQGRLWGARAADWAEIQEPQLTALYDDVIGRLEVGPGTELLDAGCGSGAFAARAVAAGARVTGLDASAELIAYARRRVPGAAFSVGDLEELPYGGGAFGLVTGFNSFQYAADPVHALREAARVAAGGRVVVAVWGREQECEAAASLRALGSLLPPAPAGAPGPFALSAEGALEKLAADAGLVVTERVEVPTAWEYADEETALRGLLAAGPAIRAIEAAGEDAVRRAVSAAIAPFRMGDGGYRLENTFCYVVAGARSAIGASNGP
jgi:SAM-dependent methyltransferase